jgi:hypothetical protein
MLYSLYEWNMEMVHRWNDTGREKPNYSKKKKPAAMPLPTTNPTWTGMGVVKALKTVRKLQGVFT